MFFHVSCTRKYDSWIFSNNLLILETNISYGSIVKFKFAQFPLDHLLHPIVSSLILLCISLIHSLIIWISFHFCHNINNTCRVSMSWMEVNFFKNQNHVYHYSLAFSNSVLFVCCSMRVSLSAFFETFKFFLMLSIHSAFQLYSFSSHILLQNCFFFLSVYLLVCPRSFSTYMSVKFAFVILECPVLFALLDPFSVSFKPSFIRQYFFFIYLMKLYGPTCLLFRFGCFILIYPYVLS